MARTNVELKTVDQLVEYAIRDNSTKRWKLDDRSDWAWNNEEEGQAWLTLWSEANALYDTDREACKVAVAAAEELRPEKHVVYTYWLVETGNDYRPTRINLSVELGEALDNIWTHRQMRYSTTMTERTGVLTLAGILKRLGKSDIKDQIEEAKAKAKAVAEKNARNYSRRQLREHAAAMKNHLGALCLGSNISVEMLLTLQDEE